MASPGVVSSSATMSPSAGSDGACEAPQHRVVTAAVTEERKRKRKESNRLSAQRSRARKQRQLDELTAQVAALRARNGAMAAATRDAVRRCAAVQAENELLRARALELDTRLQSLADLIQCMDAAAAAAAAAAASYNTPPFAAVAAGAMLHQPALLDATTYNTYY